MTKYSTEATSNDDKTMKDLSTTNVSEATYEIDLSTTKATLGPIGKGFFSPTVRGKMDVTINDAKGESRIVNIQDYDMNDIELKDRTILPFQIDTRNNRVAYNVPYMPFPIDNGTPVVSNYGMSFPGPQTTTKKLVAPVKSPAEALQLCANTCAHSNKLKFPQFKSNCVGFEFNPNTNSCYGFAPGSVKANSPRKPKTYYMGEINTKRHTLSYYSKQLNPKDTTTDSKGIKNIENYITKHFTI